MKICVIAPTVIPILGKHQKYGGIELVVGLITDNLVKNGHEVILYASGDSKTKAKLVPVAKKSLGQAVSFEKEKKLNYLAYELAAQENPDIIWDHTLALHAHEKGKDRSHFIYEVDFILNKDQLYDTTNIPVVHTLHGPARDHYPKIINELSKAGHYLVSISNDQGRSFFPWIQTGQYLGTVHNATDHTFYCNSGSTRGDYLLWVGRYCMEKGPHIALEVARSLKIPIKLMGKITEKHEKKYFNKFIKPRLRAGDEVIKHSISARKKADLYRDAMATIMPTLWAEPFGLVAIESMASGTPVIVPSKGALPEIVGEYGIVIPVTDLHLNEKETTFSKKQREYVRRIVKFAPKAKEINPNILKKRVEDLFSVDVTTEKYEKMFQKAISLNRFLGIKKYILNKYFYPKRNDRVLPKN